MPNRLTTPRLLTQRMQRAPAQVLAATLLTLVALLLRLAIAPVDAGYQYLTFFPATALAAVLGGLRAGLITCAFSLALVFYVFTPGYYELRLDKFAAFWLSALVFLLDAVIVSVAIQWLHTFRRHHQDKADRLQQALDETREAASKTAQILQAIPVMIFMKKADDLSFDYINEAGQALLGLPAERMKGKTDLDLFPPDEARHFQDEDRRVLAARTPVDFEIDTLTRPHGTVHLKTRKVGIYDQHGQAQYLLGISMDISEQVRRERELSIAAVTFETTEAVMICDSRQRIIKVNRAFCDMTGYTEAEILGKNPRFFSSGQHDQNFFRRLWADLRRDGRWNGEIWDRRKNGEVYPKSARVTAIYDAQQQVQGYVALYADISAQKASEAALHNLAFYDPLTQLPNRRLLLDRLGQALNLCERSGQHGALVFLDLDQFKALNDTHGHRHGDELLRQVAARIQACCRRSDTVARLGGDEFVALLQELGNDRAQAQAEALDIAEKIRRHLDVDYDVLGSPYRTAASLGVSLFNAGDTADKVLARADAAMYAAKQGGKNCVRFDTLPAPAEPA